jgi:chromosome segregation ATPase
MDFSPDNIRERFHDLTAQRAKIDAKLNPLRAELDELAAGDTKLSVKAARAREAKVREQIRGFQNQLFPIENERAACARALGGKTGEAT